MREIMRRAPAVPDDTDYTLPDRPRPFASIVRRALDRAGERWRRVSAEAELQRLNTDLEQRVRERTHELERLDAAIAGREQALTRAERFLYSIVEHVPDALFVKDATTLEYVLFNRALET